MKTSYIPGSSHHCTQRQLVLKRKIRRKLVPKLRINPPSYQMPFIKIGHNKTFQKHGFMQLELTHKELQVNSFS